MMKLLALVGASLLVVTFTQAFTPQATPNIRSFILTHPDEQQRSQRLPRALETLRSFGIASK